jgi:hypothetical protein
MLRVPGIWHGSYGLSDAGIQNHGTNHAVIYEEE